MNGISRLNFRPQQPLYSSMQKPKSLGFGAKYIDGDGNIFDLGRPEDKPRQKAAKNNAGKPEPLSFEEQVLANQQKMLTLLQNIDRKTKSLLFGPG